MVKVLLAILLAAAAGLVATGVFLWSVPAGLIATGLLLALWSALFLLDVAPASSTGPGDGGEL